MYVAQLRHWGESGTAGRTAPEGKPMPLSSAELQELIYGAGPGRRFTQDSPVMPDVWLAYGQGEPVDLLLTPHTGTTPGALAAELQARLSNDARVAHSDTYVVAKLSFEELITQALPLTRWWYDQIVDAEDKRPDETFLPDWLKGAEKGRLAPQVQWLLEVIIRLLSAGVEADAKKIEQAAATLLGKSVRSLRRKTQPEPWAPMLWLVSRNRPAQFAIWGSRPAVKADAAVELFNIECSSIAWAVLDCGVDARHPALCARGDDGSLKPAFEVDPATKTVRNNSRVVATYDFTTLRERLAVGGKLDKALTEGERAQLKDLRQALKSGRSIDWAALEPIVRMAHDPETYRPPVLDHGTHVAGIMTADWRTTDPGMPERSNMIGIAPGLRIYDLRVIDDQGNGDEFSVIAALQFVRWLNGYKDKPAIHGVNLSLSIHHDVANFACGKTPVCQESERLTGNGVVVVAAAGNQGYAEYTTLQGVRDEGFRSVSITDPGNAENVITVGGTHRTRPFSYGISYFSSRGPTGDGRYKPDLVAPAEKITSLVPEGASKSLDGTSMAAPHVSGAAALMLARTEELVGDPARVKQVLCKSATDLGRERYFQGAGMLDVLRALQSL
jgi:serine protease AprX